MPESIVPPATIGVLGGGQLGRYALMAASTMGYRTMVLDPDPAAPAGVHADVHIVAPYDDPTALRQLAGECAVVTTEFENPPAEALELLAQRIRVAPAADSVAIAQDRVHEKSFLSKRFPVGPYLVLEPTITAGDDPDIDHQLDAIVADGAIVKTARMGYDGKGQVRVATAADAHDAVANLGVRCVVEARLDLELELSVLVARTSHGDTRTWPVAENAHVDGILDVSVVPARIDTTLADQAVELAASVADALDYVGVLAVELFVVAGPQDAQTLLINEIAPRPHNSGHWTLDASRTSQFEQQIRAVCGVGLGDTSMTAPAAAMVNLLGDEWFRADQSTATEPNWDRVLDSPAAKLHLYGKSHPRPGRKMGHLTVTAPTADEAETRARRLRAALRSH